MFCMNILQEEKGSAVVYSDFAAIVCILFIAYSCHFSAVAKIHITIILPASIDQ